MIDLAAAIATLPDGRSLDLPGGVTLLRSGGKLYEMKTPEPCRLRLPFKFEPLPPRAPVELEFKIPFFVPKFQPYPMPWAILIDDGPVVKRKRGRTNCRKRTALRRAKQQRDKRK